MRVLHVTQRHELACGGLTTALNNLMVGMSEIGHEMAVFSVGAQPAAPKEILSYGCKVEGAGQFWLWSPALRKRLRHAICHFRPHVVHTHGCWMAPQLIALELAAELGIPTVASFHNFLHPWLRRPLLKKLKKAVYWTAVGRRVFEKADIHHAITINEADDVKEYLPRARVVVIPPLLHDVRVPARIEMAATPAQKLVFLGRIAPVKGIEQLIRGFALAGLAGKWELVIAGPCEDRGLYDLLRQLAEELRIAKSVSFIGPVYGQQKWSLLRNAWAVCVPSHTEVLGMVNLELALCGVPTITTPNSGLAEWDKHGGVLSEPGSAALARAFTAVGCWTESERASRGSSLRKYVSEEFATEAVRSRWAKSYLRLHNAHPA